MSAPDVVVVGAGPAGLAAAAILGRHGAAVTVVDEQEQPGGQIYRQPPAGFTPPAGSSSAGRALLAEATAAAGVRWLADTTVWGVLGTRAGLDGYAGDQPAPGRYRVATHGPAGVRLLEPRAVLLTAGAYDLPVPFPGWTLPGVLTAGGVQTFVKAQGLLPGGRFVLAGGTRCCWSWPPNWSGPVPGWSRSRWYNAAATCCPDRPGWLPWRAREARSPRASARCGSCGGRGYRSGSARWSVAPPATRT